MGRNGIVRRWQEVATPEPGFGPLITQTRAAVKDAERCVRAVVLGVPGPVAYSRHEVVKLPNLPRWDVEEVSAVRSMFGLPTLLANDADLAVLGEHLFGAGRNVENLVFASCGSGVGAGVVLAGRLLVGRYSLGEIGHTIIDLESRQTVEQIGSGIALE